MKTVLNVLLLYFPAFISNAAPVVLMKIHWVRRVNGPIWLKRLGAHKTWMGFVAGILSGMICGGILSALPLSSIAPEAEAIYDDTLFSFFFGGLLGAGALIGDAAKSLLKRAMGIPSGGWLPVLDSIDYVIGALFVALPFFIPTAWEAVILLFLGWFLSATTNIVSYFLGIKRVWY